MKKENVKRLLTEMIDREFDIYEVAEVFSCIDTYLFSVRESNRASDTEANRKFWRNEIDRYREWLEETLENYSLDYTIEEIEEKF